MNNKRGIRKSKILLVDDQTIILKSLASILKDEYNILVSKSGNKAIEIAKKIKDLDLILLDISMPEMSGYEVCKVLKSNKETKDIPIIFVTANERSTDEEKGFMLGAADYIIKPFKPSVVKIRVRNQIQSKKYLEMLKELAYEDSLTGLANRRTYEELLGKVWNQCAREKQFMSFIMLDIDYFKKYNDNYGHGAGDECLRKVSMALHQMVKRPLDIIARYGGEEIAVILHNADRDYAKVLTENMVKKIRELNILHEYSEVASHVTVSAGCATIIPENKDSCELIAKFADEALYEAKTSGKNRCVIWREI